MKRRFLPSPVTAFRNVFHCSQNIIVGKNNCTCSLWNSNNEQCKCLLKRLRRNLRACDTTMRRLINRKPNDRLLARHVQNKCEESCTKSGFDVLVNFCPENKTTACFVREQKKVVKLNVSARKTRSPHQTRINKKGISDFIGKRLGTSRETAMSVVPENRHLPFRLRLYSLFFIPFASTTRCHTSISYIKYSVKFYF